MNISQYHVSCYEWDFNYLWSPLRIDTNYITLNPPPSSFHTETYRTAVEYRSVKLYPYLLDVNVNVEVTNDVRLK